MVSFVSYYFDIPTKDITLLNRKLVADYLFSNFIAPRAKYINQILFRVNVGYIMQNNINKWTWVYILIHPLRHPSYTFTTHHENIY